LEILQNNHSDFDIVVSDVKMPGIDGLKLLEIIKEKYPHINRIILSGFVEQDAVISALLKGLAQTYFSKPWNNTEIADKINHVLEVKKSLNNPNLSKMINSIEILPSLPGIYGELILTINEDKSAVEIAKIINRSSSIALKMLQIANSAFYGLGKISNLENAIMRLGLEAVKNIVLTLSIMDKFKLSSEKNEILNNIFTHSLLVNKYMTLFYKEKKGGKYPKEFSSIGIMHDIGKIILLKYFPKIYDNIIEIKLKNPSKKFYDIEIELGLKDYTHTEIGAFFLDTWNLPEVTIESVLFHHNPKASSPEYNEIISILEDVDNFVEVLEYNSHKSLDDLLIYFEHLEYLTEDKKEIFIKEICSSTNN